MKIGIQILNFNGRRWLPGLLTSLAKSRYRDYVIYLVDNASEDDSVAWVEADFPEVVIVRNDENLGFAQAYNQSMPVAFEDGCDWVCLINTDVLVDADWLAPIVHAAQENARLGIMGPVFTAWDSDEPSDFMRARCPELLDDMLDAAHAPVAQDWVEGSVFFLKRECYESIGEFSSLYFMYWEEADYCRLARYHHWDVAMVPGSICKHFGGGSASGASFNRMKVRNHLVFKLTDPNKSFGRNIFSALRLSLSYAKQCLWNDRDIARFSSLAETIFSMPMSLPGCHKVWVARVKYIPPRGRF